MKHTAKRILCLLLAAFLCAGLVCVTAFAEPAQAEELPAEGTLARNVLDNCKYTLDLGSWSTLASEGGAGHLQGICTDDEGNYMYASFTNMLVKVDMKTGKIVGTVTGLAAGSISSGAHIGDICYYKGKIYGSLEYKASERWYICVFDGDKITEMDMHYTTPGVMYGLYVPQVGDDFKNELTAGEHINGPASMGHRYGTGGIDGITFGTLPGKGYDTDGDGNRDVSTGDKRYMIVTYGPYANAKRYDNENFVFLVYDPDEIDSDNLLPFTEGLLTQDYAENQKLFYKHKMFCYAGNQTYGVQQLEYDEDTGDLWLECYGSASGSEFPYMSRMVIDGSVPLYMDTVEVGQSVTGDKSGFVTQQEAHATAACYTDYEDGDGDGNTSEQETGWHMTLKCLCGNGKTLQNDHEAKIYGETGHACKVCGKGAQFATGLRSLGNGYFYGAASGSTSKDGKTYQWGTASLYKLNRTAYVFDKVSTPAKLLMSYTMDAADTYEKDGKVYLKDVSGNGYDALVEGTYAATGQGGNANTALGFRGDQYGDVLDRVSVTAEGMQYINEKVEDTYSYSFWLHNDKEMDRFTPIIGMYRDETEQKNLYDAVFEWRYRTSPAVVSHTGTSTPWVAKLVNGESYIVKPSTSKGGDGSCYALDNGKASADQCGIGKWTHWVVIKSANAVSIYQNGTQVASSANANNTNTDILSAFEIGGYLHRNWIDSNVRTRLTGLVDDVRIYSGGLSAAEVAALYQAGAAESGKTGTGAVAASAERSFGTYTGSTLKEQKDPILYLKMDETGTVKDYSGNGIDAVTTDYVTSAANKESQENRALYFDGRSHVEQTKLTLSEDNTAWLSSQINATGKMTISFWMNADFENSHRMSILGIYDKSGRPMGTFETRGTLGQDVWMDGRFAIAFTAAKPYSGSGVIDEKTYEQLAITATTPTYDNEFDDRTDKHYGDKLIDTWYHVVGELDGVANKLRLYLNGELVQEVNIAAGTLDQIGYFMVGQPAGRYYQFENAANWYENGGATGRQGWAMRDGFVGTIDEIKIYNTILNDSEIKKLYEHSVDPCADGHTLQEVAEVPATCTASGTAAHWKCTVCGKLFSDAAGTNETTLEALTISATGHAYGAPTWSWSGYTSATATFTCANDSSHVETETATITSEVTKAATCTEDGLRTYTATVTFEGKTYTDTKTEPISATGHDFTVKTVSEKTLRSAATYAEKATYWYTCSKCGAISDSLYFEDGDVLAHQISGDKSWTKGSKTGLKITVDDPSVTGVEIDGKALTEKDYTLDAATGSLTLNPSVLETLTVGEHKVTVVFRAGSADLSFAVVEDVKPTEPTKPNPSDPVTGDNSGLILVFVLLAVSAAGIAVLAFLACKRRKSHS